jgi:anti-anti-sigma factor
MDTHTDQGWWRRVRRGPVYERRRARQSERRGRLSSHDGLSISCHRAGDRQVVAASGQLDVASASQLERELRRVEATDAGEILVDLAGLEFIDSIGMEVVIHASARAQHHHKRLMIRPGPEAVHRRFERTGLAALLPFVAREAVGPQ